MPAPLCLRRRRLYEPQLTETKKNLASLAGQYPLLASALQDPELIDALEEILNIYVVYGVAVDLQRLRSTERLLRRGDADPPPTLADALPFRDEAEAPKLPSALKDASVKPGKAYERYFKWLIDPADVTRDGKPMSGVAAFYQRYPLLRHAVETVTAHHYRNIKLACERVSADWNAIQAAFFPGRAIERLVKLKTTGNDFHKGGKQVLILTFVLDSGQGGRVVYKPSAVEIDCRIVGDSTIVNAIAPKGPLDKKGHRQDASLTEILNQYCPPGARPEGFTTRNLPTYRILPYNRGSVADAYGYIEFLNRGPELNIPVAVTTDIPVDVGKAVKQVPKAQLKASDWIIEDPRDGQVFYHQFGALMAMAMAVSLSDLHVQNVITHDRRPHLIDLEDACKWPMANVSGTGMLDALDKYSDPEGNVLTVDKDRTSELTVAWMPAPVGRPASCALYRSKGPSAPGERETIQGPAGLRNRKALMRGFIDAVETLARDDCNAAVKKWAAGLDATIARFVTFPTKEYAQSARNLYLSYPENSVTQLTQDDGYRDFKVETPDGEGFFFRGAVLAKRKRFASDLTTRTWPHPYFALEHESHAWRDYLNCDVPSFYHLLGDTDLLNSKGDRVDVVAAIAWQESNIKPRPPEILPDGWGTPAGWQAPAGYLPQKPSAMVDAQLTRLKAACSTRPGTIAFLGDSLGVKGLSSDFRKLAWKASARPAGRQKVHS